MSTLCAVWNALWPEKYSFGLFRAIFSVLFVVLISERENDFVYTQRTERTELLYMLK